MSLISDWLFSLSFFASASRLANQQLSRHALRSLKVPSRATPELTYLLEPALFLSAVISSSVPVYIYIYKQKHKNTEMKDSKGIKDIIWNTFAKKIFHRWNKKVRPCFLILNLCAQLWPGFYSGTDTGSCLCLKRGLTLFTTFYPSLTLEK